MAQTICTHLSRLNNLPECLGNNRVPEVEEPSSKLVSVILKQEKKHFCVL